MNLNDIIETSLGTSIIICLTIILFNIIMITLFIKLCIDNNKMKKDINQMEETTYEIYKTLKQIESLQTNNKTDEIKEKSLNR